MNRGNLFHPLPASLPEERIDILSRGAGKITIERIVSRGHASPPDSWYDQDTVEWVALLKGSAVLRFADPEEAVEMRPGDWIEIPAHARHRVDATSAREDTIWLAVHRRDKNGCGDGREPDYGNSRK